jgi:nicotinamidase-related amidase
MSSSPSATARTRFGVSLPPTATSSAEHVRAAVAADEAGLDLIGVMDHPYHPRYLDTLSLIGMLLGRTERIHIFPDVANLPLRSPEMLAKAAASLDLLSGGRFELGLGSGGYWEAIKTFGVTPLSRAQAVDALEEAVAVIRALWSGERAVHFNGNYYQLDGATGGPPPPHPIGIWLGAQGARLLATTGRLADGWAAPIPSYLPYERWAAVPKPRSTMPHASQGANPPRSGASRRSSERSATGRTGDGSPSARRRSVATHRNGPRRSPTSLTNSASTPSSSGPKRPASSRSNASQTSQPTFQSGRNRRPLAINRQPQPKEEAMPDITPYEPLTRENTAVLLVDHQIGLMTGVRDIDVFELKHNVVALAKAAKALDLPVITTSTWRDGMWGHTIPELVDVVGDDEIIDRSTVNAWHDERVRDAVKATGATKLIIAGLSLEVCAAFPAVSALADGYQTYVAVDACGTFNRTKHETGLLRMQQAGVITTDYATPMVEILKDNADPVAGEVYGALDMPFATLIVQLTSQAAAADG